MRMILNETSYFGAGCRKELVGEMKRRGWKKAFVVTDDDLIKHGIVKMVTDELDNAEIAYDIFSEVVPNPTIANVQSGLIKFKASVPDVIVAIGGGSVIDTAKAIGIIVKNPSFKNVKSLEGVADTKEKSFPVVAFATTAGTAAEVTINYVITDERAGRKLVCVDANDIPVIAFNDAEMMMSMPKSITASTGMDALTHAIEGFITKGATPLSDMLCLSSIELIAKNLKDAVENGTNLSAREGMALGSYVAGMAFSNVGLGIVHSMAHPLGARFNIAHGVANALLLPFVMEYNLNSSKEKFAQIAKAMGVSTKGMSIKKAALSAIDAVKELSLAIGIPQRLSDIGITEDDLLQLAKDAMVDPCTGGNPAKVTRNSILEIYKKAL